MGRGAIRARVVLFTMGLISAAAAALSMAVLYSAGATDQRHHLQALAKSQAELIDAVARFDSVESVDASPGGAWLATLGQVAAGHARWRDLNTGVSLLVIGQQAGQVVTHVQDGVLLAPQSVPLPAGYSPLLARDPLHRDPGESAAEYRTPDGTSWYEVREFIPALNMAVLARLNLDIVNRPLRRSLQVSAVASLLLIALGVFLVRKTSVRTVHELDRELVRRRQVEAELSQHHKVLEQIVAERTQQLERAHAELLTSARFATLGQVTAKVSHELRNPLGTIRTSLYTLRIRVADQVVGAQKILDRLERNVVRCDRIIEELLTYTRPRSAKREWLDISQLVNTLVDDYIPALAVPLERDVAPEARFFGDPEDVRRILVNLLNNAVDASTVGGPPIRVSVTTGTEDVVIQVEDQGAGMSADVLAKAFEPLFSTKGFGVGLGLPIVRELVERNGGSMELATEPGVGTRVLLRFAATTEAA